jgi:hypothetical protein
MKASQFTLCSPPGIYLACMIAAIVVSTGCEQHTADVQGRVTIDGKPVSNAVIYFQPAKGALAQSRLDEDGKYQLVTPGAGNGTAPGIYRVYLTSLSADDESGQAPISKADLLAGKAPPPPVLPKLPAKAIKYYSAAMTDWSREVVAGSNQFDFEIATK